MKFIKYMFAVIAVALTLQACQDVTAQNPTQPERKFTWSHPEPETVNGYKIYCGNQSGAYTTNVQVLGGSTFEFPVKNVVTADGDWYCAMTAFNSVGESTFSNEVFFTIIAGVVVKDPPVAPTNLQVVPI